MLFDDSLGHGEAQTCVTRVQTDAIDAVGHAVFQDQLLRMPGNQMGRRAAARSANSRTPCSGWRWATAACGIRPPQSFMVVLRSGMPGVSQVREGFHMWTRCQVEVSRNPGFHNGRSTLKSIKTFFQTLETMPISITTLSLQGPLRWIS